MATAQDQTRTSSPPRHEAFLEEQLGRARRRIRTFDLAAGVLGFLAGTLLFGLAMIGFDLAFDLSGTARLLALAGYGLAATAYVAFFIVWPLVRSVNPYYAALRVEGTVPGAKNSIINWLDLRSRKLAPAIRNAVSNRAAHDVAHGQAHAHGQAQAESGSRISQNPRFCKIGGFLPKAAHAFHKSQSFVKHSVRNSNRSVRSQRVRKHLRT